MKPKKNPEADVNRLRPFLFQIGLVVAIGGALMAFEWEKSETKMDIPVGNPNEGTEIEIIPITEQPPPEPPKPKVIQPIITEVEDDKIIEETVEVLIDVEDFEPEKIEFEPAPVEEKTDEPVIFAEKMPVPPGGMQAFYKYVSKNMKYPRNAVRAGAEGRVFVQFVVEKDGSLTDFSILKSVGFGCDEEAIRVLDSAPKWEAGKQRGNPVRVRMVLPITFKLQN